MEINIGIIMVYLNISLYSNNIVIFLEIIKLCPNKKY